MGLSWLDIRAQHGPRCACVFCAHGPGAATGAFAAPVLPGGVPPALEPPTDPPVCVDAPYVSGLGEVGEVLTSTLGNWEGMRTDSYSYAWYRDEETVGGGAEYTVGTMDVGHEITCRVMATNAAGSTLSPASNSVYCSPASQS